MEPSNDSRFYLAYSHLKPLFYEYYENGDWLMPIPQFDFASTTTNECIHLTDVITFIDLYNRTVQRQLIQQQTNKLRAKIIKIRRTLRELPKLEKCAITDTLRDAVLGFLTPMVDELITPAMRTIVITSLTHSCVQLLIHSVAYFKYEEGKIAHLLGMLAAFSSLMLTIATITRMDLSLAAIKARCDILVTRIMELITTDHELVPRSDTQTAKTIAAAASLTMMGGFLVAGVSGHGMSKESYQTLQHALMASRTTKEATSLIQDLCKGFGSAESDAFSAKVKAMVLEAENLVTTPLSQFLEDPLLVSAALTFASRQADLFSEMKRSEMDTHSLTYQLQQYNQKLTDRIILAKNQELKLFRPTPIAILINGPKNIGKTYLCINELNKRIAAKMQYDSDAVYHIDTNKNNKYFLAYANEKFAYVDDIFRDGPNCKLTPTLHTMLSEAPSNIQGASVDSKDQFIKMRLFMGTLNPCREIVDKTLPFTNRTTKDAFWSRFLRLEASGTNVKPRGDNYTDSSSATPARTPLTFTYNVYNHIISDDVAVKTGITIDEVVDSLVHRMVRSEIDYLQKVIAYLKQPATIVKVGDVMCTELVADHQKRLAVLETLKTIPNHITEGDAATRQIPKTARAAHSSDDEFIPPPTYRSPHKGKKHDPLNKRDGREFFVARLQGDCGTRKTATVTDVSAKLSVLYNMTIKNLTLRDLHNHKTDPEPHIYIVDDLLTPELYPLYMAWINSTHNRSIILVVTNNVFKSHNDPLYLRALYRLKSIENSPYWQTDIPVIHSGAARRLGLNGRIRYAEGQETLVPTYSGPTLTFQTGINMTINHETQAVNHGEAFTHIVEAYRDFLKNTSTYIITTVPPTLTEFDFDLEVPNDDELQRVLASRSTLVAAKMGLYQGVTMKISDQLLQVGSRFRTERFVVSGATPEQLYNQMPVFIHETRACLPGATLRIQSGGFTIQVVGHEIYTNRSGASAYTITPDETTKMMTVTLTGETEPLHFVPYDYVPQILAEYSDESPLGNMEPEVFLELKRYVLYSGKPVILRQLVQKHLSRKDHSIKWYEKVALFFTTTFGKFIMALAAGIMSVVFVFGIFEYFKNMYEPKLSKCAFDPSGPLSRNDYMMRAALREEEEKLRDSPTAWNEAIQSGRMAEIQAQLKAYEVKTAGANWKPSAYKTTQKKRQDRQYKQEESTVEWRNSSKTQWSPDSAGGYDEYKSRNLRSHMNKTPDQTDAMTARLLKAVIPIYFYDQRIIYGIRIKGRMVLIPNHVRQCKELTALIDGVKQPLTFLYGDESYDQALFEIDDIKVPSSPDITTAFVVNDVVSGYEVAEFAYVNKKSVSYLGGQMAPNMAKVHSEPHFNPDKNKLAAFYLVSGDDPDHLQVFPKGICGQVIIKKESGALKIAGMISAASGEQAAFPILSQIRIQNLLNGWRQGLTKTIAAYDEYPTFPTIFGPTVVMSDKSRLLLQNQLQPSKIEDPECAVDIYGQIPGVRVGKPTRGFFLGSPDERQTVPFNFAPHTLEEVKYPENVFKCKKTGYQTLHYNQVRQYGIHPEEYKPCPITLARALNIYTESKTILYQQTCLLKMSEALNGYYKPNHPLYHCLSPINPTKSAGFYLKRFYGIRKKGELFDNQSPEGETPFFTLKDTVAARELYTRIKLRMQLAIKGEVLIGFNEGFEKEEILPRKKVEIGKIRVFIAPDMDIAIYQRIILGSIIASEIKYRSHGKVQLGIQPETEFTNIYHRMVANGGRIDAADVSRMDKHFRGELRRLIAKALAAIPSNPTGEIYWYGRELELFERENLFMSVVDTALLSPTVLPDGLLVAIFDGLLSGEGGTTTQGSQCPEFSDIYAVARMPAVAGNVVCCDLCTERRKKLFPTQVEIEAYTDKPFMSGQDHMTKVEDPIFGDDNIYASKEFPLSPPIRKELWKELGMTLTPIDKNDDGLQLPFLSREFHYSPDLDIVLPALKTSSLERCLYFVTKYEPEYIAANWRVALWESALHGEAYYNKIHRKMHHLSSRFPADWRIQIFGILGKITYAYCLTTFIIEAKYGIDAGISLPADELYFKNIIIDENFDYIEFLQRLHTQTYINDITIIKPFKNPALKFWEDLEPTMAAIHEYQPIEVYNISSTTTTELPYPNAKARLIGVRVANLLISGFKMEVFVGGPSHTPTYSVNGDFQHKGETHHVSMAAKRKKEAIRAYYDAMESITRPAPTELTYGVSQLAFLTHIKKAVNDSYKIHFIPPKVELKYEAEHAFVCNNGVLHSQLVPSELPNCCTLKKSGVIIVDLRVMEQEHKTLTKKHGKQTLTATMLNASRMADRPAPGGMHGGGSAAPLTGGATSIALSNPPPAEPMVDNVASTELDNYEQTALAPPGVEAITHPEADMNVRTVMEAAGIPMDVTNFEFSSGDARYTIKAVLPYNPAELGNVYGQLLYHMHESFAGDLVVTIDMNGPQLQQGAIAMAQVRDITKYVVGGNVSAEKELMQLISWREIRANQAECIGLVLGDARQKTFYRSTSFNVGQIDPADPAPGIVVYIYHPFANQFNTGEELKIDVVVRSHYSTGADGGVPFSVWKPKSGAIMRAAIAAIKAAEKPPTRDLRTRSQKAIEGKTLAELTELPGSDIYIYLDGAGAIKNDFNHDPERHPKIHQLAKKSPWKVHPNPIFRPGIEGLSNPTIGATNYGSNTLLCSTTKPLYGKLGDLNDQFNPYDYLDPIAVYTSETDIPISHRAIGSSIATTWNMVREMRAITTQGTILTRWFKRPVGIISDTNWGVEINPDLDDAPIEGFTSTMVSFKPTTALPLNMYRLVVGNLPPSSVPSTYRVEPTATTSSILLYKIHQVFTSMGGNPETQVVEFDLVDKWGAGKYATVRYNPTKLNELIVSVPAVAFPYYSAFLNAEDAVVTNINLKATYSSFPATSVNTWVTREIGTKQHVPKIRCYDIEETNMGMRSIARLVPYKAPTEELHATILGSILGGIGGAASGIANAQSEKKRREQEAKLHADKIQADKEAQQAAIQAQKESQASQQQHAGEMQGNQFEHAGQMQGNQFEHQTGMQTGQHGHESNMQGNQFEHANNQQGAQHGHESNMQSDRQDHAANMQTGQHVHELQKQANDHAQQTQNRNLTKTLSGLNNKGGTQANQGRGLGVGGMGMTGTSGPSPLKAHTVKSAIGKPGTQASSSVGGKIGQAQTMGKPSLGKAKPINSAAQKVSSTTQNLAAIAAPAMGKVGA